MLPDTTPVSTDFHTDFHGDATLHDLLAALAPHADKALVILYGGRTIRPGYHVTEVKAGAFVALDCGGNPDRWNETILQVEDLGPDGVTEFLSVAKFRGILEKVAAKIALDPNARITVEVGPPGLAMQVFDIGHMTVSGAQILLTLAHRPAICKPRHRQADAAAPACNDSLAAKGRCC